MSSMVLNSSSGSGPLNFLCSPSMMVCLSLWGVFKFCTVCLISCLISCSAVLCVVCCVFVVL